MESNFKNHFLSLLISFIVFHLICLFFWFVSFLVFIIFDLHLSYIEVGFVIFGAECFNLLANKIFNYLDRRENSKKESGVD